MFSCQTIETSFQPHHTSYTSEQIGSAQEAIREQYYATLIVVHMIDNLLFQHYLCEGCLKNQADAHPHLLGKEATASHLETQETRMIDSLDATGAIMGIKFQGTYQELKTQVLCENILT